MKGRECGAKRWVRESCVGGGEGEGEIVIEVGGIEGGKRMTSVDGSGGVNDDDERREDW